MKARSEETRDSCRVLVAQIGARRHYAVPRALNRMGMLETLATDFYAGGAFWVLLHRLLPAGVRKGILERLLGRRADDLPSNVVQSFPLFALRSLLPLRSSESQFDRWARRNANFARLATGWVSDGANAVYAFNGAALELFRAAVDRGLRTVLDQTSLPWRYNTEVLTAEAKRWPGWAAASIKAHRASALSDREEHEWQLSDRIVCGSPFAAEKVKELGGPADRIAVVRYPSPAAPLLEVPKRNAHGPLRVLFVGSLTLLKGVPYLVQAKERLGATITVRLVGQSGLSEVANTRIARRMDWLGAVPRAHIHGHYHWADVLVLPTLSEGSANVCHEAMAAGLPVITTPQAGSPITHGRDGLIIPAGSTEALTMAITSLVDDLDLRLQLGSAARRTVAGRTLTDYAAELAEVVSMRATSS